MIIYKYKYKKKTELTIKLQNFLKNYKIIAKKII